MCSSSLRFATTLRVSLVFAIFLGIACPPPALGAPPQGGGGPFPGSVTVKMEPGMTEHGTVQAAINIIKDCPDPSFQETGNALQEILDGGRMYEDDSPVDDDGSEELGQQNLAFIAVDTDSQSVFGVVETLLHETEHLRNGAGSGKMYDESVDPGKVGEGQAAKNHAQIYADTAGLLCALSCCLAEEGSVFSIGCEDIKMSIFIATGYIYCAFPLAQADELIESYFGEPKTATDDCCCQEGFAVV